MEYKPTKPLPGATPEEILVVPVEAQHVPVGAMLWNGANIVRVASISRETVSATNNASVQGFGVTMISFHHASAPNVAWTYPRRGKVLVVVGVTADRLAGRLAFYTPQPTEASS